MATATRVKIAPSILSADFELVVVMSVNPGFGGQSFIPSALAKVSAIRKMIDDAKAEVELEVDGGVAAETSGAVIDAGATVLVAGSAVFNVVKAGEIIE